MFISHASEDKIDVVRPLAEALRGHGLDVWYDEFELKIGDSLPPDDRSASGPRGHTIGAWCLPLPRRLIHWLDDGTLCWQAGLNHKILATVMLAESHEGNRDTECGLRIGSVHDLQVDVRFRGVA